MSSFIPQFMQYYVDFVRERDVLANEAEWIEFRRKWLNTVDWPRRPKDEQLKSSDAWLRETSGMGFLDFGGVRWGKTWLDYDLSPEARFAYSFTTCMIGGALSSGHPSPLQLTEVPSNWERECPRCEISSSNSDACVCPLCGGQLVAFPVGD